MWSYIFLGLLQGLFEWIPISSEGIVALTSQFLTKETSPVKLALFLHLGTALAILIYFRKEWKEVLMLKKPRLARFLIISTLISLALGYPAYKFIEGMVIGNALLLVTGFGLLVTAYFHKTQKDIKISFDRLAMITGFLQGLAVIPGLSRSGATIFGLSLGGVKPDQVLKISYMMSVPVVLVSGLYLALQNPGLTFEAWPSLVSSFLVGILSLHVLMKVSQKVNFFKFVLVFALLCFLGAAIGFYL